jgi:restriction system protein
MTFWVIRAGKHGETENYALEKNVAAVGWDEVSSLAKIQSRDDVSALLDQIYPEQKSTTKNVWTGELWAFKERIKVGDLVAIPLKTRAAIAFGTVTGPYQYVEKGPSGGTHQRPVRWLRTDVPRTEIDQDILYSLGSTLAVFQVQRNNAEARILAFLHGKKPSHSATDHDDTPTEDEGPADLEQAATDEIVSFHQPSLQRARVSETCGGHSYGSGVYSRNIPTRG